MAQDRYIYWDTRKPTYDQLKMLTADYLDKAGVVVAGVSTDELGVLLVSFGRPIDALADSSSEALKRMPDVSDGVKQDLLNKPHREFEIWIHKDCVNILTREQDEFVCAVADGLVKTIVLYFGGVDERGIKL